MGRVTGRFAGRVTVSQLPPLARAQRPPRRGGLGRPSGSGRSVRSPSPWGLGCLRSGTRLLFEGWVVGAPGEAGQVYLTTDYRGPFGHCRSLSPLVVAVPLADDYDIAVPGFDHSGWQSLSIMIAVPLDVGS